MSWFVSDDLVPVEVGECLCPGTPHPGGDTVWFRAALDLDGGFGLVNALSNEEGSITERLGRVYLMHGIVDWTFTDAAGAKVEPSRSNIRKLAWNSATYTLADKAAELYGDGPLAPLVARTPTSSRNGRTASGSSTSRTPSSSPRRRKR